MVFRHLPIDHPRGLGSALDPLVGARLRSGPVLGQPGKFVPLDETIESFKKLTEGDYDHIPEQAFFLCGGIEDVEANAKKLAS